MTQKQETETKRDLKIEIQNVVATASLNQTFNLLDILKTFNNTQYRPKQFPGLVFRLNRPKTATLIFSTGKMVCTGAKSEKLATTAIKKVIRELKSKGIIVLGKPIITVENIVASADLQNKVDLETAADILEDVMYEPEQFPGLIYRMRDPKTVLLLFSSGKIVCTGGKSEEMVHESVQTLYLLLEDYDLFY